MAISNHRIISISGGKIKFSYKDNKEKDKLKIWKEMELPADQFIERFLWHVLPKQYHRIRHFGFLTNNKKDANIATIRNFFSSTTQADALFEETHFEDTDGLTCPQCGKGRLKSYLVTDKYGRILKLDNSAFIRHKPPDDVS
ncbi:MAG: transposase [Dissulfuribacterales bacterium]